MMQYWLKQGSILNNVLLAVTVHVVAIGALYIGNTTSDHQAGHNDATILQAYLSPWQQYIQPKQGNQLHATQFASTQKSQPEKNNQTKAKLTIQKNQPSASATKATQSSGELTEQGDDELLMLIHHQLQKHHYYPPLAIARQQSGAVWLQFQVQPTGKIEKVKLLRSSHYQTLDQAAKKTLIAASPLLLPPKQISQPMQFTIRLLYVA